MSDASVGIIHCLRPFAGFEAKYQGQLATIPIMLFEGDNPLDPQAGKPGYSPWLLRGLPSPMGARATLWIPVLQAEDGPDLYPYRYNLIWRTRSTYDFRQTRSPYHIAKQGAGVPDTLNPAPTARVVIAAAYHPIVYAQAEGIISNTLSPFQHLTQEIIQPVGGIVLPQPIASVSDSARSGEMQQGILDTTAFGEFSFTPNWLPHEVACLGDELLIAVTRGRVGVGSGNWGFENGEPDHTFTAFYGTGEGGPYPDVGVYVNFGSSQ